jgi:hypothetical protein
VSLFIGVPPLRQDNQPDENDGQRIELVRSTWHSQDAPLRYRDRQVEENIRMLAGQHYSVWSDLFGKFIDLSSMWTEDERRWRQRPAVNHLLLWFMLLHARLTENPPIITFQPSTLDRVDAMLAEVSDAIYKHVSREVDLAEVIETMYRWLIPSGEAYVKSRIDPFAGDLRQWIGPAALSSPGLVGPDGMPLQMLAEAVPYDRDGNPLAELQEDGSFIITGEPHSEPEGGMSMDALSCLEVRGQWGASIPWHKKRWHIHRSFLTPEEVWDLYQIEVQPDTFGDQAESGEELKRLLFGDGFFGAAGARGIGMGTNAKTDGFVEVLEYWHKPSRFPGMEQTDESAGGRLLVATREKVLRDGARPFRFKYTSPIRQFQFVSLPGRPSGTSPQEMLNPIQRAYNRGWAQFLEHRNLCTNPIGVVDNASGISSGQITNKPGQMVSVSRRPGVPVLEFVAPPPLGTDSYRIQEMLGAEIRFLGNIDGGTGELPSPDSSGELVKELRFNSDRFVGPTARRSVTEIARVAEDWMVMIPLIWDQQKILTVPGEDNIVRAFTVLPEILEGGKINAFPDVESMLPESRGERQAKVRQLYVDGAFGPPGSPPAIRRYMELSRFPHLSRAARPGGVHYSTAQTQLGQLLQGVPAPEIPVFPWYDSLVHLEVLEEFMASTDFLSMDVPIQAEIVLHHSRHEGQLAAQAAELLAQQQAQAQATNPDGQPAPAGGESSPAAAPAAA